MHPGDGFGEVSGVFWGWGGQGRLWEGYGWGGWGRGGEGGGSEPWEGAVLCRAGNVFVAMPTPGTRPAGDSALRECVTVSPRSYGTRGGAAGEKTSHVFVRFLRGLRESVPVRPSVPSPRSGL